MGKVLNTLVFVVLTCNCVAYSYSIRNKYRRMPVDRSSQGLAQVMSEKNGKVVLATNTADSKQSSEPAGIPLPTLSSAAKNVVLGIRNDLSNLGGTLIGGFSEVTGLKLKKKPGLPVLDSLVSAKKVKKSGDSKSKLVQYSKREHNLQREKQYKRQTTSYTGNFDQPPYTSPQKDLPTIWYTEPKQPLHGKIGDELKGVVNYFLPGNSLFQDENEVNIDSVRGERDSAYGAPEAPVEVSYGAPVEPSYGAPVEPSYGAPVEETYGAPVETYGVPSYEAEGDDLLKTLIYGSEEKLPLLLKVITDYNKVFNFYAGQSAQIAAFYAPGLIPILRKFGFDVKRIKWVPELIEKLKPKDEGDSYGAPVASYGEPAITYEEPEPAYGAPEVTYEEPEPAYGAPAPAYQPAATEPVPVYHAPENSYAAPSHYAPPQPIKRAKKQIKKTDEASSELDVVPEHHEELLTAVPALELLKLKKKLNKNQARKKVDEIEERSSNKVEESEEVVEEDRTSRLNKLKETLDIIEEKTIEEVEEEIEQEMDEA